MFCLKAKNFLNSKNIPLTWIDVETEDGSSQLFELQRKHNWKTIPMIFVNGEFVGGYQEMMKGIKSNKIISFMYVLPIAMLFVTKI